MFAGRGKMSRKEMQNNMKAMLAKTKVADVMTAGSGPSNSAYQPKKHFQPPKSKQSSSSKNEKPNNKRPANVRQPTASEGSTREKKEVIVNSQKSIYKPNLKRVDSS